MWQSLKVFVEKDIIQQPPRPTLWSTVTTTAKTFVQLQTESTPSVLRGLRQISYGQSTERVAAAAVAPQEAELSAGLGQWMTEMGVPPQAPIQLPETNPLTMTTIDWAQEISKQNLENLRHQTLSAAKLETAEQETKAKRIARLIQICLASGNISLAMMLFSHTEAREANELTKTLMGKVQGLQDQKRKLADQIAGLKNDAEGSKNLTKLQNEMQTASDDIGVLQTFIREVASNKQQALELSNAFMNREHETAMSIIRGR